MNYTVVGRLEQFEAAEAKVAELAGVQFHTRRSFDTNSALGKQEIYLPPKLFKYYNYILIYTYNYCPSYFSSLLLCLP